MSPDVHFERSQADVLLLAVFTAEGFPRLVRVAVQLLVLEESRVRGVRLATQGALEFLRFPAQFGQLVLVAAGALRTAVVVLGRRGVREGGWVARDGGEVAGERGEGQAAGSPYGDRAVGGRAEDLGLRDDREGEALVEVRCDEDCRTFQLTIIWLFGRVRVLLHQKRPWHLGNFLQPNKKQ